MLKRKLASNFKEQVTVTCGVCLEAVCGDKKVVSFSCCNHKQALCNTCFLTLLVVKRREGKYTGSIQYDFEEPKLFIGLPCSFCRTSSLEAHPHKASDYIFTKISIGDCKNHKDIGDQLAMSLEQVKQLESKNEMLIERVDELKRKERELEARERSLLARNEKLVEREKKMIAVMEEMENSHKRLRTLLNNN